MHYYKRNIGDYHKKAGRLTMLQHGAYTLLIDACYDRETFPTMEEALDWTWAATDDEIAAVKFVLSKFFALSDGVYVQQRIADEIGAFRNNSAINSRIAKEREAKRRETKSRETKNTNRDDSSTNRDDSSTNRERVEHEHTKSVNEPPPNQEPRTINHKPITKDKDKDLGTAFADPQKTAPVSQALDFTGLCLTNEQIAELKRIRKKNKGGALTQRVVNALAKEFEQAAHAGWNPEDLLSEWEMRGWKGFKADWLPTQRVVGMSALMQRNIKNTEDF